MKIQCTNKGCGKATHSFIIAVGLIGAGKKIDGQWFCSHQCYGIYLADRLIGDKRHGLVRAAQRVKLGRLLIKNNLIDEEQLNTALVEKRGSYKRLGEILVELGYITEKELKAVLCQQSGAAPIELDTWVKFRLKEEIPFKLIDEFHFVVFDYDEIGRVISIALYDMDHIPCLGEYFSRVFPGHTVKFHMEQRKKILHVIFNNYPREHVSIDILEGEGKYSADGGHEIEDTVHRLMAFLNKQCTRGVSIKNRDNGLHIEGETGQLKIDVRITRKRGSQGAAVSPGE
jgi:hypothetical protein